jgi:hypothetical protein
MRTECGSLTCGVRAAHQNDESFRSLRRPPGDDACRTSARPCGLDRPRDHDRLRPCQRVALSAAHAGTFTTKPRVSKPPPLQLDRSVDMIVHMKTKSPPGQTVPGKELRRMRSRESFSARDAVSLAASRAHSFAHETGKPWLPRPSLREVVADAES